MRTALKALGWAYLGLGALLLTGVIAAHLPIGSQLR
jgi:hypothetical protein